MGRQTKGRRAHGRIRGSEERGVPGELKGCESDALRGETTGDSTMGHPTDLQGETKIKKEGESG